MTGRRFGHLPDRIRGDWSIFALAGAGSSAPAYSDGIVHHVGYVADQGSRSSCVGEAVSQALYAGMGVQGFRAVRPSPSAIYYDARHEDGIQDVDIGSRPSSAYRSISVRGFCPERECPRSWPVDQAPPWGAYRLAADNTELAYYRIVQRGGGRCEAIRQALAARQPVTMAIQVDHAYQDSEGVWPGPSYSVLGGHYVLATHYGPEGLWHVGSYGTGWGNAGYCLMPWSAIARDDVLSDVWAITFVPKPLEAS